MAAPSSPAAAPTITGSFLAAHGPAVIVTINYRLGPLGFLQLHRHGLTEANNLALQDTLAALDWVRANIANFGGDPDVITLSGQSAGASMVIALATLPHARGKFIRALALSAPGRNIMSAGHADDVARHVLEELELARDPSAIASVPLPKLFAAVERVGRRLADETDAGTVFGPVLDGTVIAREPRDVFADGTLRDFALARLLPRRDGDVPEEHAAGRDDPHHRATSARDVRRCRLVPAAIAIIAPTRASTRIRTRRCCRMRSGIAPWPISRGVMLRQAARCG